jgi:hypothetical protein
MIRPIVKVDRGSLVADFNVDANRVPKIGVSKSFAESFFRRFVLRLKLTQSDRRLDELRASGLRSCQ